MSTATLTNCTATQYSAQEFAGDSVSAGNLELQSPPAGATLTVPFNQFYYLTIEASPGYRINTSMVSLGINNDGMIQNNDSINGVVIYNGISESDTSQFPSDLDQIRIYDSEPNTVTCNNKVIVELKLSADFVMPNYDYTVNLDLNATALPCEPIVPNPDNNGIDDDGIWDGSAYAWYTSFELIPITAPLMTAPYFTMYAAKYYEEETYVVSPYNGTQVAFENWNNGLDSILPPLPDYDVNGSYAELFDSNYKSCNTLSKSWKFREI